MLILLVSLKILKYMLNKILKGGSFSNRREKELNRAFSDMKKNVSIEKFLNLFSFFLNSN